MDPDPVVVDDDPDDAPTDEAAGDVPDGEGSSADSPDADDVAGTAPVMAARASAPPTDHLRASPTDAASAPSPGVTSPDTDAATHELDSADTATQPDPGNPVDPSPIPVVPAQSPPITAEQPDRPAEASPSSAVPDPHPLEPTPVPKAATPPSTAARTATVLAIANQKGGVGKTTTTVSVAAAVAEEGHRVLVVDLDPQGNASTGLGQPPEARKVSTYDVLLEEATGADATLPTDIDGLDLLPASLDLAGAEIELVPQFSRESRLRKALAPLRDDYDLILVDCPPSLGLLTINALVAADRALVPIQCEFYALEGLGQLMKTVNLVAANLNQDLALGGIALTMFDGRTNLSQQVVDEVRNHFGELVFDTVIPRTVRLSEAPSYGQPITVFDSASRGARSYRRLALEVATRFGLRSPRPTGSSALDRLLGPRPNDVPAATPTEPVASDEQEQG